MVIYTSHPSLSLLSTPFSHSADGTTLAAISVQADNLGIKSTLNRVSRRAVLFINPTL